jgi:poly-beta-hydroxyalkanoate depolymerase
MLYDLYEFNHAAMAPFRAATELGLNFWKSPGNPWSSSSAAPPAALANLPSTFLKRL